MIKNRKNIWTLSVFLIVLLIITTVTIKYEILFPIIIAFALSYAFNPLILYLKKKNVSRILSTVGLMVTLTTLFFLIMGFIIPSLIDEFQRFGQNFPEFFSKALEQLKKLGNEFNVEIPINKDSFLEQIRELTGETGLPNLKPLGRIVGGFFSGAGNIVGSIIHMFFIPVFFLFILKDLPKIKKTMSDLIPYDYRDNFKREWEKIDCVLSGFIRGQLLVASILAGFLSVSFALIGVKFGLFIGILSGFLNVIPYVGQLTGLVLALLMTLVDFSGWGKPIAVICLFASTNFLEGWFLTPRVVGKKVGLPVVWTLVALICGGKLGGIVGILISIPVAGILKILILDFVDEYKQSDFYKGKK